MSAILTLFNIFTLIYIFRGLQLVRIIWREWSQIKIPPLTRHKKHLGEQASFFIAVPIGVFLHELSHALAVWLFGGQVIEFGYRVFWGYVLPSGIFSPTQDWFISLAGTLGSLIFGMSLWLFLRNHGSPALRYFGLRAFRFQVYFSLIYYPVFTLMGFVGDWKTIYDFSATPLASGLTIPFHVGMLFLFWRGDRTGWFEMPGHESTAEKETYDRLERETAVSPHDMRLQLQYIDALRRAGVVNKAKNQLKSFIRQNPDSGAGYLQLAALETAGKNQPPRSAVQNAEKALYLGLDSDTSLAYAYQLLGKYYLDIGDADKAIYNLSEAIAHTNEETALIFQKAHLFHWRSLAHRRQRQYENAYQDLQRAISLVQESGDETAVKFYQGEVEILEKHAGRMLRSMP